MAKAWCGAVMALAAAACVTVIPHATEQDASTARREWPDASLATLEQGRSLYQQRCSGCHALYSPAAHTPQEWSKAIPEMAGRAKLTPAEQRLLLEFLVTLSKRSVG